MEVFQFTLVINVRAQSAKHAKAFVHTLIEHGRISAEDADTRQHTIAPARVENHHTGRLVDTEEWIPVRSKPKEGNPPGQ